MSTFTGNRNNALVFNVDSSSLIIKLRGTRRSTRLVDRTVGAGLSPVPAVGLRFRRIRNGGLVLLRVTSNSRAPCCCVNSGRHITFVHVKGRSIMTSHVRLEGLILGKANGGCSDLTTPCEFSSVSFAGLGSMRFGHLKHSFRSSRFAS